MTAGDFDAETRRVITLTPTLSLRERGRRCRRSASTPASNPSPEGEGTIVGLFAGWLAAHEGLDGLGYGYAAEHYVVD